MLTTIIYTLSLHDALPIFLALQHHDDPLLDLLVENADLVLKVLQDEIRILDRKSTRLNSSHPSISYAVFCLKKKHCGKSMANTLNFPEVASGIETAAASAC